MERLHWVRHRCQQLLVRNSGRGWYSAHRNPHNNSSLDPLSSPLRAGGKRRIVYACHGPHQRELEAVSRNYKDNAIHTTKYSLWTFIPMNLFQQFHRVANLYFLFLALLNWVPVVEAFQKEITMIPLLVVLLVIATKDALEDYGRYLFDKRVNNNVVRVFCGTQQAYTEQRWKDVQVGDFVLLTCNEIIPADVLLLYSSDPRGVCYIETANLDGETNLKQRQVVPDLPLQETEFSPENFHSRIVCEKPNNDLRRFRGYIEHAGGVRVGLQSSNLLLRSCTIRNTDTVVGIVVYAGHETKAILNNSGPRCKRSRLEKHLNTDVLWCVFLLLIMCVTAATGHGLWLRDLGDSVFNVGGETSPALAAFYVFWTMIIVLQVLIPISLYVSIEIVKLGQIYFIHNDLTLYNEQLDSRIQCRALNINEDLGQVQYLFSDKTGTLTENKMVFRRCSIYGVEYPHEENARRLLLYEEEEELSEATAHTGTITSGCAGKPLSCPSLRCSHSAVSLHSLSPDPLSPDPLSPDPLSPDPLSPDSTQEHQQLASQTSSLSSLTVKEVVPDPQLVQKVNGLCSPLLTGSSSETPSGLELACITDFFLALTVCNSVVVSSPSQPPHAVPTQTKSPGNFTSKLLTQGRTGSITSTPNSSTPSRDCSLRASRPGCEEEDAAETMGNWEPQDEAEDMKKHSHGSRKGMEDLLRKGAPEGHTENELLYEAESPDEAALVHAARAYGCVLKGRSPDRLLLQLPGLGSVEVLLLHTLPFDSTRRRMSVVVRHPLTQQVVVYTKGADSVIMDLAKTPKGPKQVQEIHNHIREQTQNHLDMYARDGLRTLCIAKKILEEEEYGVWLKKQLVAESSIENREELLLDSALRLETNLSLLGTTGIVDRLQEDVPESIEALQRAGIRVWVLTGDKQETAISIAYACKLLHPDDRLLTANCASKDACAVLLEELKVEVQQGKDGGLGLPGGQESSSGSTSCFILVIDGQTLDWALQEELSSSFLELSSTCKAVICCRSTPLQKSQVVQLIRTQLGVMTLAVGDGANDVSMIQVADVGIGIFGQEGMQAVMASDFAISRFKHLRRLLLVHGHWCFSRLANMILYFIYKNVMYVNLLFWYQFFCGFSGSVMTNSWVLIFFNLLFTSIPPIIYGILDRDTPADTLMELPELYPAVQTTRLCGPSMFWITVLDAFFQSLVCFFVPYFALAGSDVGELSFASPVNASALLIILIHQILESNTLTWIHVLVLLLSAALYWGFVLLFSELCVTCSPPTNPLGVETLQMSQPLFYIICALTTVTALLPRLLLTVLSNTVRPSAGRQQRDNVQEASGRSHRTQQGCRRSALHVCAHTSCLQPSTAAVLS